MNIPDRSETRPHDAAPPAGDVTPTQLVALMTDGEPVLLDVREPAEWRIARLPGARLVPLSELAAAVSELDPSAETVVYCHHGTRSAYAAAHLRSLGFSRVRNLLGGIDRWSVEVDPSTPRY